jgi:hypothetical protein
MPLHRSRHGVEDVHGDWRQGLAGPDDFDGQLVEVGDRLGHHAIAPPGRAVAVAPQRLAVEPERADGTGPSCRT